MKLKRHIRLTTDYMTCSNEYIEYFITVTEYIGNIYEDLYVYYVKPLSICMNYIRNRYNV